MVTQGQKYWGLLQLYVAISENTKMPVHTDFILKIISTTSQSHIIWHIKYTKRCIDTPSKREDTLDNQNPEEKKWHKHFQLQCCQGGVACGLQSRGYKENQM